MSVAVEAVLLVVGAGARHFAETVRRGRRSPLPRSPPPLPPRAVEAAATHIAGSVVSSLDRPLGMLERFPVGRDQLGGFLLERLAPRA